MRHKDGPQGTEEQAWSDQFDQDQIIQDGYPTQQATKPQTLSYAMMDSPVGIAAWILEKMHGWSDIKHNNIESEYPRGGHFATMEEHDLLITDIRNFTHSLDWQN